MTGIAALAVPGGARPADGRLRSAALAMARALAHRGAIQPRFVGTGVVLAPLGAPVAALGPLRAVADARLDRPAELARDLGLAVGDVTDVDLLLRAWDAWGDEVIRRVPGDYAAAIWDDRSRTLVLLRDALGVRPLYLARRGEVVVVASETHALAASGLLPPLELDPLEASRYLVDDYAEDHGTYLAGVAVAQPAGTTTLAAGIERRRRLWSPDAFARAERADLVSSGEALREALRGAVRRQMPDPSSAAVLVSGGLDSSAVACVAALEARARGATPPPLLHLAFPGLPCDEDRHFAAVVATTRAAAVVVDPRDRPALCAPGARTGPGELYHPTLAANEALLDAADLAPGAVLLGGFGGDDLLHQTGLEEIDALRAGRVAEALRAARARRLSGPALARHLLRQAARAFAPGAVRATLRRWRRSRPRWPAWLTPEAVERLAAWHQVRVERRAALDAPDEVQRQLVLSLVGDSDLYVFLARLDRFGARRGVALRHPFYDREVVELLLRVPAPQRATHREVKGVLREAMRGVLPEVVRTRGDAADFLPWVRDSAAGPHREAYRELLASSELERIGLVRPGALLALLQRGDVLPLLPAVGLEVAIRTVRGARATDANEPSEGASVPSLR